MQRSLVANSKTFLDKAKSSGAQKQKQESVCLKRRTQALSYAAKSLRCLLQLARETTHIVQCNASTPIQVRDNHHTRDDHHIRDDHQTRDGNIIKVEQNAICQSSRGTEIKGLGMRCTLHPSTILG